MRRTIAIAIATAALAAGCGGVDPEEELPAVDELAADVAAAQDAEAICALVTGELAEDCPDDDVSGLVAADVADAPVELGGSDEIADHSLSFDGDTGRLVLCAAGPDCVSDLGAYVLTLERVDGRWRIDAIDYRVESF